MTRCVASLSHGRAQGLATFRSGAEIQWWLKAIMLAHELRVPANRVARKGRRWLQGARRSPGH